MGKKRKAKKEVLKYHFRRKPYKHQVEALRTVLATDFGGALLMEPRTGKTQVALDYAAIRHLQGHVNRVLIVCPIGPMGVWAREIEAVIPEGIRWTWTIWDKDARKVIDLPSFGKDRLDFVIINDDAFSVPGAITEVEVHRDEETGEVLGKTIHRSKSRGGRYTLKKQLQAWQPQLVIYDESHRIKTPSSRKTTFAWSIAKWSSVKFRIIATGTVVTKRHRIIDIYSQWKFLNPDGWIRPYTFDTFKDEFAVFRDGHTGNYKRWVRNKNEAKLRIKIHKDSFAIAREECFDMPPLTHSPVPVRLTGYASQVYDEMVEKMIVQLKNGELTEAQIKLVLRTRLVQITSGLAKTAPTDDYPEGRWVRIGKHKLVVIQSLLEDLFAADRKVVVPARWRADVMAVYKLGLKLKVPTQFVMGGVKREDRDVRIEKFQKTPGAGLMVCQPKTMAEGIDLSAAADMIWYSLTDSFVTWTQMSDRIALHPGPKDIQYLLCEGTVDELLYSELREDQDVLKYVMKRPDRLRRLQG